MLDKQLDVNKQKRPQGVQKPSLLQLKSLSILKQDSIIPSFKQADPGI